MVIIYGYWWGIIDGYDILLIMGDYVWLLMVING